LRTFTEVLVKSGYVVETATKAVKKLGRNRYDAALIDITFPEAEGTDLLKTPKAFRHRKDNSYRLLHG
jgi:DNA-binding response OmpR family regulator